MKTEYRKCKNCGKEFMSYDGTLNCSFCVIERADLSFPERVKLEASLFLDVQTYRENSGLYHIADF